jgi:hypothetical protein
MVTRINLGNRQILEANTLFIFKFQVIVLYRL